MFDANYIRFDKDKDTGQVHVLIFYQDESIEVLTANKMPKNFVAGRNYCLSDLYGYEVKPMREEDNNNVGSQSR